MNDTRRLPRERETDFHSLTACCSAGHVAVAQRRRRRARLCTIDRTRHRSCSMIDQQMVAVVVVVVVVTTFDQRHRTTTMQQRTTTRAPRGKFLLANVCLLDNHRRYLLAMTSRSRLPSRRAGQSMRRDLVQAIWRQPARHPVARLPSVARLSLSEQCDQCDGDDLAHDHCTVHAFSSAAAAAAAEAELPLPGSKVHISHRRRRRRRRMLYNHSSSCRRFWHAAQTVTTKAAPPMLLPDTRFSPVIGACVLIAPGSAIAAAAETQQQQQQQHNNNNNQ